MGKTSNKSNVEHDKAEQLLGGLYAISGDTIVNQLPHTQKLVGDMLNGSFGDRLFSLRDRWQDEREYEDFDDYKDEVKQSVGIYEGFSFLKMTKGFTITLRYKKASTVGFFSPKWFAPFSHLITLKVKATAIDAKFEEEPCATQRKIVFGISVKYNTIGWGDNYSPV